MAVWPIKCLGFYLCLQILLLFSVEIWVDLFNSLTPSVRDPRDPAFFSPPILRQNCSKAL
jgi:hypothetical protein